MIWKPTNSLNPVVLERSDLADGTSRNNKTNQNNPQIKQSTENTRRDQPSNLIPHDKDHTGDPMKFCPDLSQ
jgi:hypothetical protein